MSDLAFPDDIQKEFTVDDQGRAFASQRGIARLLNVDPSSLRYHVRRIRGGENTAKSLKTLTAPDLKVGDKLPEQVLAAFAKYYTYEAGDSCTTEDELRTIHSSDSL